MRLATRCILAALAGALCGWATTSRADIVTEVGMGYKLESTTSVVLLPDCHEVWVVQTKPDRPDLNYRPTSCGGSNPAFIGWPIAWERRLNDGPWTVRVGWFHYSHWFDGKSSRETHLDALAVSFKLNWSERRRNRR